MDDAWMYNHLGLQAQVYKRILGSKMYFFKNLNYDLNFPAKCMSIQLSCLHGGQINWYYQGDD
jgi:hypothetical protein